MGGNDGDGHQGKERSTRLKCLLEVSSAANDSHIREQLYFDYKITLRVLRRALVSHSAVFKSASSHTPVILLLRFGHPYGCSRTSSYPAAGGTIGIGSATYVRCC